MAAPANPFDQVLAFLKDSDPVESVPLESPLTISWTDPVTGKLFRGYKVDVAALTNEELHAIYADIRKRFPFCLDFDSWAEFIKKEGMPIREEKVEALAIPNRLVD